MTAPLIGGQVSRVDGRAKTTGGARYAADYREPEMAHAVVVQATIGLGRVTAMHTDAATKSTGVLAVYSPFNPLRLYPDPSGRGENYQPLQDRDVRFRGQTIGVVVADSFQHARDAAALITADYGERSPRISLTDAGPGATIAGDDPGQRTFLAPGVASIEEALRAGDVVVETIARASPSRTTLRWNPMRPWRFGAATTSPSTPVRNGRPAPLRRSPAGSASGPTRCASCRRMSVVVSAARP